MTRLRPCIHIECANLVPKNSYETIHFNWNTFPSQRHDFNDQLPMNLQADTFIDCSKSSRYPSRRRFSWMVIFIFSGLSGPVGPCLRDTIPICHLLTRPPNLLG